MGQLRIMSAVVFLLEDSFDYMTPHFAQITRSLEFW
jgi:hypothetical protein